ncbi:MAG TPA: SIR2 family protein [Pyrinomonadaceae bacterium]|jgi:hypothetical protein
MDAGSFEKLIEQKSLSLDKAALQIRKACEERQRERAEQQSAAAAPRQKAAQEDADPRGRFSGRRPFFFLVGAGISFPPIPLAASIEEECRRLASGDLPAGEQDGLKPIDTYSFWFDQAFPHPLQRQLYLRQLIQRRTISHASFRLAHLLLDRRIANVVVTLNFDDFISRALALFGRPYIICDHPATVERISPEQDDIQILHVHGTYWFYDCANLRSEIADRALASMQTNRTMAYKLDDVMERSSPIVIGYSGWEQDVVMTALKRRLSSTLPYRMYWFCYQDPKPDSLPEWLVTHPQVFFVTPSAQKTEGASAPAAAPAGPEAAGDQRKRGATLDATIVLERLIREFKLEAPHLFTDPLEFFAQQLEASLPEGESGAREDNYFIKSLVAEVREINRKTSKVPATLLRRVIQALRRSEVREAIALAGRISFKESRLDETQLHELMNAMWLAARGLFDSSAEELHACDIAIAAGRKLLEKKTNDAGVLEVMSNAMVNKSDALRLLGQRDEALKLLVEVEKLTGGSTTIHLRRLAARAMLSRGAIYRELRESVRASAQKKELEKKETAAYRALTRRFGRVDDAEIAVYVAYAINNEAFSKLVTAKPLMQKRDKKANATKKDLKEMFERALDHSPKNPIILSNLGYLACLSGETEVCRDLLKEAIGIGGERIKLGGLEDAKIKPVLPQDEVFTKILGEIDVAKTTPGVGKSAP